MDCAIGNESAVCTERIVLLIEEYDYSRYALQALLKHWGYTVIGKKTIREAEAYLAEEGGKPIGLIIFDINLHPVSKEVEGYAFFRRQTEVNPDVPFILISADYTIWDLPSVRSMTAHFLTKPFDPEALRTAVRTVLNQ
jgi:DNA-binding NtrC family response regulator